MSLLGKRSFATGEVGSIVREAIKHGEQSMAEEAMANGKARQHAE